MTGVCFVQSLKFTIDKNILKTDKNVQKRFKEVCIAMSFMAARSWDTSTMLCKSVYYDVNHAVKQFMSLWHLHAACNTPP